MSGISLGVRSDSIKLVKVFRLARVLRPLRLVNRIKVLKIALYALMKAIPSIFNVVIVSLLFFVVFGILFVDFFKGTFFSCTTIDDSWGSIVTKFDCLNLGGTWVNADNNFDNTGQALFTVFQMATTSGWAGVMYQVVDSVAIDYEPVTDNTLLWSPLIILFEAFAAFFIMNLFDGAVLMTFNQEKARLSKENLLSIN